MSKTKERYYVLDDPGGELTHIMDREGRTNCGCSGQRIQSTFGNVGHKMSATHVTHERNRNAALRPKPLTIEQRLDRLEKHVNLS